MSDVSEPPAPPAGGALFLAQETDPDLLSLRKAIIEYPENDTPRCAYADRLGELGFPGVAKRIFSQVQNRNRRRWVYNYLGSAVRVQYHRGFVDVVGGHLPALKAIAPTVFRRHPVREAQIWREYAMSAPNPDDAPRHPLRVIVNAIGKYTYCVPPASYVLSGDQLTITPATTPAMTYRVSPPQGFPGDVRFYFNCAAVPKWLADRWPAPDEKNRLPFLYDTVPEAEAALAATYVRYGRWAAINLPDALPKRR